MEQWKIIDSFPNYEVSDHGRVRREVSGRLLSLSTNQYGLVQVGLMRGSTQFHRSVPKLVARAFVPPPRRFRTFDTPINLDGNRENNHKDNLVWRPRWFAVEYNRQFKHPYDNPIDVPIEDVKTGEITDGSFETAIRYGLLEKDVVLSILNLTYAWPTYQEFQILE